MNDQNKDENEIITQMALKEDPANRIRLKFAFLLRMSISIVAEIASHFFQNNRPFH